jgi:hypothetical protein
LSNHFSAAKLKFPGDDARLDLTDLFVFAAPDNPERTVLIMDSNPFTQGNGFHPDAVYRCNVDTDGDALADVAFSFTFSELQDGRQTATAGGVGGERLSAGRGEDLVAAAPHRQHRNAARELNLVVAGPAQQGVIEVPRVRVDQRRVRNAALSGRHHRDHHAERQRLRPSPPR